MRFKRCDIKMDWYNEMSITRVPIKGVTHCQFENTAVLKKNQVSTNPLSSLADWSRSVSMHLVRLTFDTILFCLTHHTIYCILLDMSKLLISSMSLKVKFYAIEIIPRKENNPLLNQAPKLARDFRHHKHWPKNARVNHCGLHLLKFFFES